MHCLVSDFNSQHLRYGCVVVAALLHYLPLTTLMWTATEVRLVYRSTLEASSTDRTLWLVLTSLTNWGMTSIVILSNNLWGLVRKKCTIF